MTVYKVDGIGTRKDGSGGEVANFSEGNKRFIRIGMYVDQGGSDSDFKKGDAVAIEIGSGDIIINGVNTAAKDYIGLGNMVVLADSDTADHRGLCIGVLGEDVSIAAGEYKYVSVQVSGLATVGTDDSATAGDILVLSADAGGLRKFDADADNDQGFVKVAIALEADATDLNVTAGDSCQAILLNPLGL